MQNGVATATALHYRRLMLFCLLLGEFCDDDLRHGTCFMIDDWRCFRLLTLPYLR